MQGSHTIRAWLEDTLSPPGYAFCTGAAAGPGKKSGRGGGPGRFESKHQPFREIRLAHRIPCGPDQWNWSASVLSLYAVVDEVPPETAVATASK